jgi:hypothetical protein
MPGAIIRGRVVTSSGEPVPKARIRLGMPVRGIVGFSPGSAGITRADGSFELVRLAAGEWSLELEVPPTPAAVRPPLIFYPGVIDREEAKTITLAAGDVVDRVDFVVPDLSNNALTLRVSPVVAAGSTVAAAVIRASPLMTATVVLDADGVGRLGGLLPGRYFAAARTSTPTKILTAFEVVDFTGDPRDVLLSLQPAGSITGRLVAQRGVLPPLEGVRVAASWVHDDVEVNPLVPDQVQVAADGSFRIDGLFGQRVIQLIGLPADWGVNAVLEGRRDVTRGVAIQPGSTATVSIVLGRR